MVMVMMIMTILMLMILQAPTHRYAAQTDCHLILADQAHKVLNTPNSSIDISILLTGADALVCSSVQPFTDCGQAQH